MNTVRSSLTLFRRNSHSNFNTLTLEHNVHKLEEVSVRFASSFVYNQYVVVRVAEKRIIM